MKTKTILVGAGITSYLLVGTVSAINAAQVIANVICGIIPDAINLAYFLALAVFIYGGAKYAYSADDPGGRKQAKSIAINALIGFIIVAMSYSLIMAIKDDNSPLCS